MPGRVLVANPSSKELTVESPEDRQPDEEARAAAEVIRVASATGPKPAAGVDERGYKLYVPRPASLAVALWVWLLVSAFYVVVGVVTAYVRMFQLPDGEGERYRLVPGPADARTWVFLGLGVGLNLLRLAIMAAAVRGDQASRWVRAGWTLAVVSSLIHPADFVWKIGSGISSIESVRTSPAPVAVTGLGTLVLLVLPPVLAWVWRPPPLHAPDWTYGEGEKRPPFDEMADDTRGGSEGGTDRSAG